MAILFREMGNIPYMKAWASKALEMMNANNLLEFSNSFFVMISDIHNQFYFSSAHAMYKKIFLKICKKKSNEKDSFLKNYLTIEMTEKDIPLTSADEAISLFSRCSTKKEVQESILRIFLEHASEEKDYDAIVTINNFLEKQRRMFELKAYASSILAIRDYTTSNPSYKGHLLNANKNFKKSNKRKIPYETLIHLSTFSLRKISRNVNQVDLFTPKFPRNVFSNQVTQQFKNLANLKSEVDSLYRYGEGPSIVKGHKWLLDSYQGLIKKLSSFAPAGFSKEHLKRFQEEMKSVTGALRRDQLDIKRKIRKLIFDEEILSPFNQFFVLDLHHLTLPPPTLKITIMDRLGGRR